MKEPYFLGIDIGTQGARVVLIDAEGELLGSAGEDFPLGAGSREEQRPDDWWAACTASARRLFASLRGEIDPGGVRAVAVTSTSGTVIPLDGSCRPLHAALMYSDPRSRSAALRCTAAAERYHPAGYAQFNASSGLSKMVWFVEQYPRQAARIARWIHAADYITGMLSGVWDTTDYTNALKSGFDVSSREWPAYLYEQLPLRREWLEKVVASGLPLGQIHPALARELGLTGAVTVVAPMTDGCASQIASGAAGLGEWNTTIGTTLVVKGITRKPIEDPGGSLYCHRHPDADLDMPGGAAWMPGGASNTGADWITRDFATDLAALNEAARALIPTGEIAWPLLQKGERFPFVSAEARGFAPAGLRGAGLYTANLEGVAYLERMAYERIRRLSGEDIRAVYTAGGGSESDVWLNIRSNVLNLPVYKMRYVTGAVGAAILAASRTAFGSVDAAVKALTRIERVVEPDPVLVGRYRPLYDRFLSVLAEKGYVPAGGS